jgi:hypothetical protein
MENAIQRLGAFEGRWHTTGKSRDHSLTVEGTDTYEWFSGGHFMEHRVDVKMGEERVQALEMISYDAEKEQFHLQYWNNAGDMSAMHGTTEGRTWTFSGGQERGVFTFNEAGTQLTGTWERREDNGSWTPWLDIVLTKES